MNIVLRKYHCSLRAREKFGHDSQNSNGSENVIREKQSIYNPFHVGTVNYVIQTDLLQPNSDD
jgi:hypothetical protein